MKKRIYPRTEKPFFAIVENGKGMQLNVIAVNTSTQGICIQCNTYERDLITPGGSFISENGKPIELSVKLELPQKGANKTKKVSARCYIAYSRRVSNNQCRIGMRYSSLDRNVFETLAGYIERNTAA